MDALKSTKETPTSSKRNIFAISSLVLWILVNSPATADSSELNSVRNYLTSDEKEQITWYKRDVSSKVCEYLDKKVQSNPWNASIAREYWIKCEDYAIQKLRTKYNSDKRG